MNVVYDHPSDRLALVQGMAVNLARGIGAALKRAIAHCPAGHEYSPENTYVYRNRRSCKKCRCEARVRAKLSRDRG